MIIGHNFKKPMSFESWKLKSEIVYGCQIDEKIFTLKTLMN
jgi:hypothetical protein